METALELLKSWTFWTGLRRRFGDVKEDVSPGPHWPGVTRPIFSDKRWGDWGDSSQFAAEDTVRCTLWGAHPRNNLQRNSSFGTVWRWQPKNESDPSAGGQWQLAADDSDYDTMCRDTKLHWWTHPMCKFLGNGTIKLKHAVIRYNRKVIQRALRLKTWVLPRNFFFQSQMPGLFHRTSDHIDPNISTSFFWSRSPRFHWKREGISASLVTIDWKIPDHALGGWYTIHYSCLARTFYWKKYKYNGSLICLLMLTKGGKGEQFQQRNKHCRCDLFPEPQVVTPTVEEPFPPSAAHADSLRWVPGWLQVGHLWHFPPKCWSVRIFPIVSLRWQRTEILKVIWSSMVVPIHRPLLDTHRCLDVTGIYYPWNSVRVRSALLMTSPFTYLHHRTTGEARSATLDTGFLIATLQVAGARGGAYDANPSGAVRGAPTAECGRAWHAAAPAPTPTRAAGTWPGLARHEVSCRTVARWRHAFPLWDVHESHLQHRSVCGPRRMDLQMRLMVCLNLSSIWTVQVLTVRVFFCFLFLFFFQVTSTLKIHVLRNLIIPAAGKSVPSEGRLPVTGILVLYQHGNAKQLFLGLFKDV